MTTTRITGFSLLAATLAVCLSWGNPGEAKAATIYINGTASDDDIRYVGKHYVPSFPTGYYEWVYCLNNNWVSAGTWGSADTLYVLAGDGEDVVYMEVGTNDRTCGGVEYTVLPVGHGACPTIYAYMYTSTSEDDNDTYYGSNCGDFASGGDGDDLLVGGDGYDEFHGGWGDDQLWGYDGGSYLDGDQGNDQLVGGDGADVLEGGDGYYNDELYGGGGNDCLDTSYYAASCSCGAGTDAEHCYGTDGTNCESHTTCL